MHTLIISDFLSFLNLIFWSIFSAFSQFYQNLDFFPRDVFSRVGLFRSLVFCQRVQKSVLTNKIGLIWQEAVVVHICGQELVEAAGAVVGGCDPFGNLQVGLRYTFSNYTTPSACQSLKQFTYLGWMFKSMPAFSLVKFSLNYLSIY